MSVVSWTNAAAVESLLTGAAELMRSSSLRRGCTVALPSRGRILATGDLHDNPEHFRIVMELAELDGSSDNHVMLHELIHGDRLVNGLDLSYRMLCRVAEAVCRWPLQVHPVLANHELAQAIGQRVSKGSGDQVAQFDAGLEYVFGDDAELIGEAVRDFVMAMPLALRGEHGLCCSHSIPAPRAAVDAEVFSRALDLTDYTPNLGAAWRMVWGRGLDAAHAQTLAQEWSVKLFVVGHAHVEAGVEARGEHLLVVNSDHDRGAAVRIDLSEPPPSAGELVNEAIHLGAFRSLHG